MAGLGAIGPNDERWEGASDVALALGIARWHEEALAEAYRRHGGAVFALARQVLGERTLAEEVVQEVFIKLWYQTEMFDPGRGSMRSYLFAQTHGRAVDLLRSEVSRRKREAREFEGRRTIGSDLETEVETIVAADKVRQALGVLPECERQPIELAYFGGRTYRQVAEDLDQPEGTIKSRIRAGLMRLRANLTEAGVDTG